MDKTAPDAAGLRRERWFTLFVAALVSIGPFSISMYMPSMPDLVVQLNSDPAQIQLTLTLFLAAFAVAQIAYGPLSDAFGRRPALIAGFTIYTIGSLVCALAPSVPMLIAGRVIQAIGACAGGVVARALIRDRIPPQRMAGVMATMSIALALAPGVGPMIGGHLHVWFGWRSTFYALGGISLLLLAMVFLTLRESNTHRDIAMIRPGRILANFITVLKDAEYCRFALIVASAYGGMFAYISGSPFLLITVLGLTPDIYGYATLISVGGFMVGSILARRFEPRLGLEKTILLGGLVCTVGGLGFLAEAMSGIIMLVPIMTMVGCFQIGVGILLPTASVGAVRGFPKLAGSASALLGFLHMAAAAGTTVLVAHFNDPSQRGLGVILALAGLITFATAWVTWQRRPA